jgi:phosphate transport system permease protein
VRNEEPSAADRHGEGLSAFGFRSASVPGQPEAPRSAHQEPRRRSLRSRASTSDLVFRGVLRGGGAWVLVIMILVGTFLGYRAWQALTKAGWSFLTTQSWNPGAGGFGIAAVMVGTILIALVAVLTAVPLAMGAALYINEYAPRGIQRGLISVIDLMAAVPSVVFGLWGFKLFQWKADSVSKWISDWFFWIPLFKVDGVQRGDPLASMTHYTSSTFLAGLVVALMVTPIACSIMR